MAIYPMMLNVTKDLEFSNPNFSSKINYQCSDFPVLHGKTFLPDNATLASLSAATYKDNLENNSLPSGWELLTTAKNKKDGYFGATYINDNKVVIVHRGTQVNNINSILTDIEGIIYNQFTSQIESACSFACWVLGRLNLEATSISLTGHSLGAWLAQITTFTIKYLNMNENGFSKKEFEDRNFHPHTVVFDSPGCYEMLLKLSENYICRYENKICYYINRLDITTYLSAPNLVNTCNRHVGTLYRVYPELPKWGMSWEGFCGKLIESFHETIMYSLENHGIKGFSAETIKNANQILDWPLVTWPNNINKKVTPCSSTIMKVLRLSKMIPTLLKDRLFSLNNSEYKTFFEFAISDNAYDPINLKENLIDTGDIFLHYKVVPLSKNQCSVTIFSERELIFLESLLFIRSKNIQPMNLNKFLSSHKLGNHYDIFKNFNFSLENCEKLIIFDSEKSLKSTINFTKLLFLYFPELEVIIEGDMANIHGGLKSLLHSKTADYLFFNRIFPNENFFEDTVGLMTFLESFEPNVMYFHSVFSDFSFEPRRIHEIWKIFKHKFSNESDVELDCCFLYWFQILDLKKNDLIKSLTDINLLVLDCQFEEINDLDLLKDVLKMVKKTIIIVHLIDSNVKICLAESKINFVEFKSKELVWQDFTEIGQKKLLQKSLVVLHNQKKKITFEELLGIDLKNKWASNNFGEFFCAEVIAKLLDNEVVNIGQSPLHFSDLDSSYVQLNEEISPRNLVDFLCGNSNYSPYPLFIVSDFQLVKQDIKQTLINLLGLKTTVDLKKIDAINNEIEFVEPSSYNFSSGKRLLIVFNEFHVKDFHEVCQNNSNQVIFWLTFKQQKLFLSQIYNPLFYRSRQLKFLDKLVIDINFVKNELLKDDPNYIFFFSNTNESNFVKLLGVQSKELIKRNIQFYDSEEEAEEELFLMKDEKPIHWIHVENNELTWKCSNTSLKPLINYEGNSKSELPLNEKEIIKQNFKSNSAVIISGGPGMGKSATLAKVAEMMQSSHWVVKIHLRNCLYLIDNLYSNKITLNQAVDFILRATKHNNKSIEKKLIEYKIEHRNRGKPLVLLFDGFDEVKDESSKRKLSFLLRFLEGKVSVWITSRKHDIKLLRDSLFVFETELIEFKIDEQKEVLKQFWKICHFLVLDRDKCTEYFETPNPREGKNRFDIFTDFLFDRVNKVVGSDFIEVPLQLRLLAEGFRSQFFKFASSNNYEPNLSPINLLYLFKQFIDIKIGIYLKDKLILSLVNNVSVKWFKRPIIKRHMRLSFMKLFGEQAIQFIAKKPPLKKDPNSSTIYLDDELNELYRVGLVHFTQNESFDFIHQTIAEYFSSKFLIYLLKKPYGNCKTQKALELLLTDILLNPQYKLIHLFLNDYLSQNKLPRDLFSSCQEIICKLFNESPEKLTNEKYETPLHIISKNNYSNLLCFLLNSLTNSSRELTEGSIDFICLRSFNRETALFEAIKSGHVKIIETFLCAIEMCKESVILSVLLSTIFGSIKRDKNNHKHKELLKYLDRYPNLNKTYQTIGNKWAFLDSFLLAVVEEDNNRIQEILRGVSPEVQKYLLLMTDGDGNTLLHIMAAKGKWTTFKYLIEFYSGRDLFYLMHIKNEADRTVMHILLNKGQTRHLNIEYIGIIVGEIMNKIPEKDRVFLISTIDSYGISFLHLAAEVDEWDLIVHLINYIPDIHQHEVINLKNKRGNRIIDFAVQKASLDIVKYLFEKGADFFDHLVTCKPCILHEAVCNKNPEVLKFVLGELHKKYAGETQLISHYVNAKDYDGDSPLMWASEKGNISAVHELLAEKEININAINKKGMTALDWAKQNRHLLICVILQGFMNGSEIEQPNYSCTSSYTETYTPATVKNICHKYSTRESKLTQIISANFDQAPCEDGEDHFFRSLAQCMNKMDSKLKVTSKSLRQVCKEYALNEVNNENSWLKTSLKQENEGIIDIYEYANCIKFSPEETKNLVHFICGRPHIEGRIICEAYNVKLHVMKFSDISTNAMPRHIIINSGITVYDDIIDYFDNRIIHILEGLNIFVSLLPKTYNEDKKIPYFSEGNEYDSMNIGSYTLNEQASKFTQKDDITSSVMEVLKLINLHPPLPMGAISLNDDQIQKLKQTDKDGNNCLMNAAYRGDLDVVKFLIRCSFDVNCENPRTKQKAIDLAWDNSHYDIMLLLLKADSEYPSGFELCHLDGDILIPEELKTFVKERESISEWIKNDDLEKIKIVVSKYPCSKLLNSKNCLALEIAAKCGSMNTISILLGLKLDICPEKMMINLPKAFNNSLSSTINKNGDTLLMVAAEDGNEACVVFLISCKVDVNHQNNFGKKAVDLAWCNEHFKIVLILLKADSEFPKGFCVGSLSESNSSQLELIHFTQQMTELHALIEKDDCKQIEEYLSKVKLKFYLNIEGHSAAFTALRRKKFLVLSYLLANKVAFKNEVESSSVEKLLSAYEKDSLKAALIPYFPSFENAHIYFLIAKSRSLKSFDLCIDNIKTFYAKLNSIPEVSKILQVVQYADYLDIVFDFNNENIKAMNPTATESTKGTTDYKEGRLYIAAKADEDSVLGTLAHELAHLAMEMVFLNDCNPYEASNKSLADQFKEITESIQNNETIESFLRGDITDNSLKVLTDAFKYKKNEIQSELIVRVPHLLSQFKNVDEEWFCSTHKYLCPLFKYYTEIVLDSCDNYIAQSFFIKPRNTVKSLNESVGLVNKIRLSNVCFKEVINLKDFENNLGSKVIVYYTQNTWLAVLNIHQSLHNNLIHYSNYLIFNFSNYLNYCNEIDKAFYSDVCTLLVLECSISSNDRQLLSKHLEKWIELIKQKPNKQIIFVVHNQEVDLFRKQLEDNKFCSYRKLNNYTLSDITFENQKYILNKPIDFQGEKIALKNIIDQDENSLKLVDGDILTKLILNEEFGIGKKLTLSNDNNQPYYINRMIDLKIYLSEKITQDEELREVLAFSKEDFINLCGKKENVHWLEKCKGSFILKNSKGPISALLEYKIERTLRKHDNTTMEYLVSERDLINVVNHSNVIIISDAAGTGKTTLLSYMLFQLKTLKPMSWVYLINLNHYTEIFEIELLIQKNNKKLGFNDNSAVDFLLEKLLGLNLHSDPKINFEKRLLEHHLKVKSNGLILLLDGFDEISPDYKDLVISLIISLQSKVEKLLVTTRSHMSMALESKLGVFAYTLYPLSCEEQTNFFVKYWHTRNPRFTDLERLKVYSSRLIELFNYSIKDQFREFTGIPLQCRMLAEIFELPMKVPDFFFHLQDYGSFAVNKWQSLEEFYVSSQEQPLFEKKIDILELYDLFIYKKYCDIYETEKKCSKLSNLSVKSGIKKAYPTFINEHFELSLHCVFTKRLLKNLLKKTEINSLIGNVSKGEETMGIVDQVINGNIIFVHKTFAEYFVAKFFIQHLEKCEHSVQSFLLTKLLLNPEYLLIRTFFNEHLIKINPIDASLLQSYGHKICSFWRKRLLINDLEDTPLHLAAREGCLKITDFILRSLEGEKTQAELINSVNKLGSIPIHYAAEIGHFEMIKLLVRYGSDVNAAVQSNKKRCGKSVLYIAAEGGHSNVVKWLVENGADINSRLKGNSGMTMLHLAAEIGDLNVAQLLVDNGADTSVVVSNGLYSGLLPLHLAAIRGHWDLVEWFISDCKVDVNTLVPSGQFQGSSIFVWAPLGYFDFLKNHGANIDAADKNGNTALHLAAQKCDWEVAKWLIDNNANINAKNNLGLTPLHVLAAYKNEIYNKKDIFIEYLVMHGADIYAKDNDGFTPLHAASFSQSQERVKTLMKYIFNGVSPIS